MKAFLYKAFPFSLPPHHPNRFQPKLMPEGKAEESQGQSRAAEGRGQGRAGQGRAAGERDSAQGRGRQGRAGRRRGAMLHGGGGGLAYWSARRDGL